MIDVSKVPERHFSLDFQVKLLREQGKLTVNFWNPVLQPGGIVKFISPEACSSKKFIKDMELTEFVMK